MSNFLLNGITILLAVFFFGLLIYGFYIVLKPAPKNKNGKKMIKTKNTQIKNAR